MSDFLYKSILGSRSYDISIPESDVDIGVIKLSSTDKPDQQKDFDVLPSSYSEFISDMLGPNPRWFFTQFLFPESFEEKNHISKFIIESREDIIGARRPVLYKTIKRRADGLANFGDRLYKTSPKRLAYSTLFYSILGNYAEGMPFHQAHRPEGELHDFLIGMRLGQVPLEDAVARNRLERLRAEKAAGFYKEPVHPETLQEFEQIIQEAGKEWRSTV